MGTTARRIRSTPQRSASDTWELIVDLIAPKDGDARNELLAIHGIASSIISSEAPTDSPIVVSGNGPQVRLYCLYGEKAIAGDDANEEKLAQCPTEKEWVVSLPADKDDVDWVADALNEKSSRITVRNKDESYKSDGSSSRNRNGKEATIDMEAFFKS